MTYRRGYNLLNLIDHYFANLHITLCNILLTDYVLLYKSIINLWVNSFMQSLLQKVSFYLCLRPMNNEDKMTSSAAVTAQTNSPYVLHQALLSLRTRAIVIYL